MVKECDKKKRIGGENWGSRWMRISAVERWARLNGGLRMGGARRKERRSSIRVNGGDVPFSFGRSVFRMVVLSGGGLFVVAAVSKNRARINTRSLCCYLIPHRLASY